MAGTEDEIRAIVEERLAAVRAKDARPLLARQSEDVVLFDVLPPLASRGRSVTEERTRAWFDSYASEVGYAVEQLEIAAGDDVAFCSFVYNVTGTLVGGKDVSMWVRATLGLRRIDGRWQIVHDHESVPWDPVTGMGVSDLGPSASAN